MTYVYIKSEPNLWTVGFYDPQGNWHPDTDWNHRENAAKRVHYLNGGLTEDDQAELAEYQHIKDQHKAFLS